MQYRAVKLINALYMNRHVNCCAYFTLQVVSFLAAVLSGLQCAVEVIRMHKRPRHSCYKELDTDTDQEDLTLLL